MQIWCQERSFELQDNAGIRGALILHLDLSSRSAITSSELIFTASTGRVLVAEHPDLQGFPVGLTLLLPSAELPAGRRELFNKAGQGWGASPYVIQYAIATNPGRLGAGRALQEAARAATGTYSLVAYAPLSGLRARIIQVVDDPVTWKAIASSFSASDAPALQQQLTDLLAHDTRPDLVDKPATSFLTAEARAFAAQPSYRIGEFHRRMGAKLVGVDDGGDPSESDSMWARAYLRTLRREVYAIARGRFSTLGGSVNGHLGTVMTPAAYLACAGVAYAVPVHPGPHPCNGPNDHLGTGMSPAPYLVRAGVAYDAPDHPGPHPSNGQKDTAAQITERNRDYLQQIGYHTVRTKFVEEIRSRILEAVDAKYFAILSTGDFGLADVTALDLLTHLEDMYGIITPEAIEANRNLLGVVLNIDDPLEDLWVRIKNCQDFADAAAEPITDPNHPPHHGRPRLYMRVQPCLPRMAWQGSKR